MLLLHAHASSWQSRFEPRVIVLVCEGAAQGTWHTMVFWRPICNSKLLHRVHLSRTILDLSKCWISKLDGVPNPRMSVPANLRLLTYPSRFTGPRPIWRGYTWNFPSRSCWWDSGSLEEWPSAWGQHGPRGWLILLDSALFMFLKIFHSVALKSLDSVVKSPLCSKLFMCVVQQFCVFWISQAQCHQALGKVCMSWLITSLIFLFEFKFYSFSQQVQLTFLILKKNIRRAAENLSIRYFSW